jgi:hypothetical protein
MFVVYAQQKLSSALLLSQFTETFHHMGLILRTVHSNLRLLRQARQQKNSLRSVTSLSSTFHRDKPASKSAAASGPSHLKRQMVRCSRRCGGGMQKAINSSRSKALCERQVADIFSSARSRLALSCNVSSFLGFWCGGGIGPTHGDAMSSDAQVTQSAQFLCI